MSDQLQAQVQNLKIRLFDTSEQLSQYEAHSKQLSEALSQISGLVNVKPNQSGEVTLASIVDAVKALVAEPEAEEMFVEE